MKKAIVVLMTLVFTACGGDDGWAEQDRIDFVAGCENGGAPTGVCECVQEKLEEAFPDISEFEDDPDLLASEAAKFQTECSG